MSRAPLLTRRPNCAAILLTGRCFADPNGRAYPLTYPQSS